MAHHGPVRFGYVGDKAEALRWTRTARLCVYKLQKEMAPKGVLSARRIFQVADNVEIDVTIAGAQITVLIKTGGGMKRPRWFEDFVVFAGQSAYIGGQLVYFPVILSHAPTTPNSWVPYFYSAAALGFDAAPSPKGVYREVFPKGVFTGQVTHINERGEAVSWYGMAHNQYMWPPYRNPTEMYMGGVYHMGSVLFDTSEYEEANPGVIGQINRVVSAAIRDGYLYILFGEHVYNITYTVPPAPAGRHDTWASPMYPTYPLGYQLMRFPIRVKREEPSGMLRYVLSGAQPERLWQGELACAIAPWIFDKAVRTIVSYSVPENPRLVFGNEGVIKEMPNSTSRRFQISINEAGTSASFGVSPAGSRIAEDDGNVLYLEQDGLNWRYRLGPHIYPAITWGEGNEWTNRTIYYADLRTGYFVFAEVRRFQTGPNQMSATRRMVLCLNGVETELQSNTAAVESPRPDLLVERNQIISGIYNGLPPGCVLYGRNFGFAIDRVDPIETHIETGSGVLDTPFIQSKPNVSFGGALISRNEYATGQQFRWDLTIALEGNNYDPGPYIAGDPGSYYVIAGGMSLAEPYRIAYGTTPQGVAIIAGGSSSSPGSGFVSAGTALNYITDSDLAYITGGVVGTDGRTPLSISILGKPPVGQPLEYPSGD